MNIFEFESYRDYLIHLSQGPDSIRGIQAKLARAANCQASYFSQALKGKTQLTEDQALGIAEFLEFSVTQTNYFLLLLRYEKAGTQKLADFLKNQIRAIKQDELSLVNQVGVAKKRFKDEDLAVYSRSWIYSVVHILTSTPGMTTESIASRLSLPKETVMNVLKELGEMGFVTKTGAIWKFAGEGVHVPQDSRWHQSLQLSRRSLIERSITLNSSDSTHFSSVFTIDPKDFLEIRKSIGAFVHKSHETIYASGTSDLACLCLDLFKIE